MIEARRFGAADLGLLVLVLALAGGVRAWYVAVLCHSAGDDGPFRVQHEERWERERDDLVKNWQDGAGFKTTAPLAAGEELTAHTSPIYSWLLAQAQRFRGDADLARQLVRWVQCGLGTLTVGFYFLFARRAFQSLLVGTLAGVLTALHPYWVANTPEINDGVLATFLLGLCLFLGVRGGQRGGPLTSFLYGLGLAGVAMLRAALFPFAFLAALWYLYRCRTVPRGWLFSLLMFLGFINGLWPWALRNYQVFGEPVPIVDSLYLHLWMGNNPQSDGGPQSDETVLNTLPQVDGQNPADLGQKKQPERYRSFTGPILQEFRRSPSDAIQHRLRSGLAFLFGTSWLQGGNPWREETTPAEDVPDWLSRSARSWFLGSLLGMLLLGFVGWRWSYGWKLAAMPSSLAVILVPLPYLLSHAEVYAGPRLPLDGVLLSYAAFVLACVVPSVAGWLLHGDYAEPANP